MTITIDETKALELIDAAVTERGEGFIYQNEFPDDGTCQYALYPRTDDHEPDLSADPVPGCLIGLGLALAVGLTPGQLVELDGCFMDVAGFSGPSGYRVTQELANYINQDVDPDGEDSLAAFDVEVTEGAARILQAAQDAQDDRGTWGTARDRARVVAELLAAR